jgi:hypothetical protein
MIDARILVLLELWQFVLSDVHHGCDSVVEAVSTVEINVCLSLAQTTQDYLKVVALACDRTDDVGPRLTSARSQTMELLLSQSLSTTGQCM